MVEGRPGRGRDSAIAVAVIGAVGVIVAALIQSCDDDSPPPVPPPTAVVSTAGPSPTPSLALATTSPTMPGVAYPAAEPVTLPELHCTKMTLRIDQVAGVKQPVKTGVSLDVTGSDLWPGDPRQIWLFISGGDAAGIYPSVGAARRGSGGWRVDGVLLGRPGHPEDVNVSTRFLHVALLPVAEGDKLAKSIADDTFDWANGLPNLPPGHVEVARVPLDREC